MVVKSNASIATQAATKRLEKVIDSHRLYFSEWRSEKFDRSVRREENEQKNKSLSASKLNK